MSVSNNYTSGFDNLQHHIQFNNCEYNHIDIISTKYNFVELYQQNIGVDTLRDIKYDHLSQYFTCDNIIDIILDYLHPYNINYTTFKNNRFRCL